MHITGNPHLKSAPMFGAVLSYMWIPTGHLSFNAYGNIIETFKRGVTVYEPFDNGNSLLRTYINDGNIITSSIGLSATCKTFGDRLQIYANARQSLFRTNSRWNIRLTAANFFNHGWREATERLESSLNSSYTAIMGVDTHSKLRMTATYTFCYGKKISAGNEIGQQSGSTSAILK